MPKDLNLFSYSGLKSRSSLVHTCKISISTLVRNLNINRKDKDIPRV